MTTQSWRDRLRADVVPWLLERDDDNPGVRYFALTELLEAPAEEGDVRRARQAVMRTGPVPAILRAQHRNGYWVRPGSGYGPKYTGTVWQIMLLAELGANPADARVRRACRYLLDHAIAVNGAFAANQPPTPSADIHCLNGNLLGALARLGFVDDPRVRTALDEQAREILGQPGARYTRSATSGPGFACSINRGQPCAWGATKVMKALLAVPGRQRTARIRTAIGAGAAFLLSRNPAIADYPYTDRVSRHWFRFGFPQSYWSDVLETVEVLAGAGHGANPRLAEVVRLIEGKQDERGR